jgi:hypothetical protein
METIIARVTALLADRNVSIVLPAAHRSHMEKTVTEAKTALTQQQYCQAWSLLREARFWWLWKEYLEKAAPTVAFLPPSFRTAKQDSADSVPTLVAAVTRRPVTVDGQLDEPEWQKGVFAAGFVTRDRAPAFAETAIKSLHDDRNLYLAVLCADRDVTQVKADAKEEKDLFAVMDDALAIFLQPDDTLPTYYQLAFNANAVQFDQRVTGAERDYAFHPEWTVAVRRHDGYWVAEVQMPFSAFGAGQPDMQRWRINVHRVFRHSLIDPCSWSFSGRDWHQPARFGRLTMER